MKYIKSYAALLLVFLTLFFCACGKNNTPAPEMTEVITQYSVTPPSGTRDEETRSQTAAESETDTQTSANNQSETAVRSSAAEKASAAVKTTEKQTAVKTETATTSAPSTTKQGLTKVRSTRRSSGRNEKTEVSESTTETSVTVSETETVTAASTTAKKKVRPKVTPATQAAPSPEQTDKTVHVKIICTNAVNYGVKGVNLPANGIMADCEVPYTEGMTGMDALKAAAKLKGIEVDESHGYVRGIGGLYEKDCSGSSGWLYNVNGEYPNVSCDKYKLNENDTMTFIYTAEAGDVKMN
jgi:hypothetical protein